MRDALTFGIERAITVDVAREQLFDVVTDDGRFFDLRPGAVAHREILPLENGGHACTQEFEVNGRRVVQACRALRFERPSCMVDNVVGPGFSMTATTTFEDVAGKCLLRIRYEVALTQRVNALRRRATRYHADRRLIAGLARIKTVAEAT